MPSKIITNGRLEYLEATIDVTYSDIGEVTYRGSRPIIVSNQWRPTIMPAKGDLIMLDGKQYRVLKMNDTVAEVLAMYDASIAIAFGNSNIYAGESLDTYCNNTFYSGLSSAMKSAIIDKTFTQDSWSRPSSVPASSYYTGTYSSETYYLTLGNTAFGPSITRHCYALSVQDVLYYLEATTSMTTANTTLTSVNLWKMFWNQTASSESTSLWLRSANADNSTRIFYIIDNNAHLFTDAFIEKHAVRPAFQIDLSKVDWEKV